MTETITDNQDVILKEKIKKIFNKSQSCFIEKGLCPTKDVLTTVLDKWSLFCVYNLGYFKVLRFNELKSRIDGVSSRMLSVTLKKLKANDLVTRKIYAEVPPRVEYSLTPFGIAMASKVIDLSMWFIDNHRDLTAVERDEISDVVSSS